MKGIMIDPEKQVIEVIDYSGDYTDIYTWLDCRYFDCVVINKHSDAIFIDEEWHLRNTPIHGFMWLGYPNMLIGKGLILGCDDEGESKDPHITIDEVAAHVVWVGAMEAKV